MIPPASLLIGERRWSATAGQRRVVRIQRRVANRIAMPRNEF